MIWFWVFVYGHSYRAKMSCVSKYFLFDVHFSYFALLLRFFMVSPSLEPNLPVRLCDFYEENPPAINSDIHKLRTSQKSNSICRPFPTHRIHLEIVWLIQFFINIDFGNCSLISAASIEHLCPRLIGWKRARTFVLDWSKTNQQYRHLQSVYTIDEL